MEKSYQEICAEIDALKQQAATARAKESAGAIAEARRLIKAFDLSAADCGFTGLKGPKKPVAIKYRHPENASFVWTGRGKAPKWLTELEAQGQHREHFLVQPAI